MKSRHWLMLAGALVAGAAQGQTCRSDISESTPAARFELANGGATVHDSATGLEWKRCPEGFVFSDNGTATDFGDDGCTDGGSSMFTWQQALQNAEALNTGGGYAGSSDWRVPNVKELDSIVERACFDPAIDLPIFPGTPSAVFWSSSPYGGAAANVWNVSFGYGFDDANYVTYALRVRLVRGGQ